VTVFGLLFSRAYLRAQILRDGITLVSLAMCLAHLALGQGRQGRRRGAVGCGDCQHGDG
jgi:hypothetical protein